MVLINLSQERGTERQTDRQTDEQQFRLMPLHSGGGHNNRSALNLSLRSRIFQTNDDVPVPCCLS